MEKTIILDRDLKKGSVIKIGLHIEESGNSGGGMITLEDLIKEWEEYSMHHVYRNELTVSYTETIETIETFNLLEDAKSL